MTDTGTDNTGLFAEHKDKLPEEWHEAFDVLVGQGKSPSTIMATIAYVTTLKTQREVSQEYSVSTSTIRELQDAVIEHGPIDAKLPARNKVKGATKMELCNKLADQLGWEEGVEYKTTSDGRTGKTPKLLKQGWQSLNDALTERERSS